MPAWPVCCSLTALWGCVCIFLFPHQLQESSPPKPAQSPAHISHFTLNFEDWEIAIFQPLQSCTQSFAEQEQGILKCTDERDREAVIHTLRLVPCFITRLRSERFPRKKLDFGSFLRRILMQFKLFSIKSMANTCLDKMLESWLHTPLLNKSLGRLVQTSDGCLDNSAVWVC